MSPIQEFWLRALPLIVAIISLGVTLAIRLLDARRERDKVRFGIVYEEQFRVSRTLYVRLSRLRDAVEDAGHPELSNAEKQKRYPKVLEIADGVRRCVRQDDVLFPEDTQDALLEVLSEIRDGIYPFQDALAEGRGVFKARTELLNAIDRVRNKLRPMFRRHYGLTTQKKLAPAALTSRTPES